ncbi:MAG: hypothetical protein JEZ02_09470 [Desulfatibacillum sp.]|nr:hypothetical protein [Desulfatibacillum sp.]
MKSWIAIALSAIALTCATGFAARDAIFNMTVDHDGAASIYNLAKVLKNFNDHRITSEQTRDCSSFLANSLDDFRFQKIYDSQFLVPGAKGYKGLTFHGRNEDNAYIFDLTTAHSTAPRLDQNGSMIADVAFKHHRRSVVGEPSFSTYVNAAANTGRLSHLSVNRLIDGLLLVLSPDNVKLSQEKICKENPEKCGQAFDVVAQLRETFPNSEKFFGHFMDLKVDSEIKSHEGKEFNHVTVKTSLFLNKLNDDYPWTAAHLDHLENSVRTHMRFFNEFDHLVMESDFQTREDFLTFSFNTRNGKVVPVDGFGKPYFVEEFSLSNLNVYPLDIVADLYTKANGLRFATEGLRILVDYEKLDQGMLLSVRSDNLVNTRVSGRALYIFPTWSVDWLLPASMEELVYDFSTVMIQANEGEGSIFKLMCNTTDPKNTKTQAYASTEILDNFFVRFGAKMASDYFGMGPITAKEAKAFRSKALEVIMADFQAMAQQGQT